MISPGFSEMLNAISCIYHGLQIRIKIDGIEMIVIHLFDIFLFIYIFIVVLIDLEKEKNKKTEAQTDTEPPTEPQEDDDDEEERVNPDHYQIWNNWY